MYYTNSQMIAAIEEHVHSAWQREALKLRYIDGDRSSGRLRCGS